MVSLEGVIENDEPPGDSGLANATHSRKRKLLKPFKPPTRVAPPPAPADDAWGPPGREYQCQRRVQLSEHGSGAGHEGRGALPPRSSYTGFGQVESLSDGEDEEDEGASLDSVARGARWEIGAAEEYRRGQGDRHDGQMGYFAQARSEVVPVGQSSSLAATAPMSGYTWEREDWRASDGAGRSAREANRGEMPPPRSQDLVFDPNAAEGPVHDDEDHRTGESYLENCQNDADGGAWPQSARDSTPGQRNRANGVAPAMGRRQELDQRDDSARRRDEVENGQLGGSFVSEVISGHLAPESGSEHGGLRGQEQTRSTQDIISLFGGFGEEMPVPSVDESVHVGRPRQAQQAQQQAAVPLGPRGPDKASPIKCSRNHGGQDFLQPESCPIVHESGGGEDWAAERRRMQKAAHVAEEGGRVGETFVVGGVDSAHEVDEVAVDEAIDWACDVCGVRGSPPSNVCRVCGNVRQVPGSGGREENGDPPDLLSGGGADGSGDASGVGDIEVDLENIDRDERGRARGNALRGRQQGVAEENQWHDQDRRRDGGGEVGGDNVGAASGTGRGGVTHLDRFTDDPFDEHVTPQEEREAQLSCTSSSPSRCSLSQSGAGGCNSTSACGGGSTPGAGSDRRNLSVRMLMDLGSSSESDSG